jgi:hypothetical protein
MSNGIVIFECAFYTTEIAARRGFIDSVVARLRSPEILVICYENEGDKTNESRALGRERNELLPRC